MNKEHKNKKQYPKEVLNVIPNGDYCHGKLVESKTSLGIIPLSICPFWFKIKKRKSHENGYCVLLGKGDYEINREKTTVIHMTWDKETGKEIKTKIKCGPDNPSFMSLLWDQCKEFGCPKYK